MKDFGYIELHCPYCGRKININIKDNVDSENFEEKYYCECGNNSRIEYDIPMGRVNIGAIIYLKDNYK